jgi:hypothetical protein
MDFAVLWWVVQAMKEAQFYGIGARKLHIGALQTLENYK